LVAAVFPKRLGVGDTRKGRRGHSTAAAKLDEDAAQYRLDCREHVLLSDERHFEIELIELAGCTVGARRLVAKARRDLKIAVKAGDHQQLLELLRRLRQGVELAGVQSARHIIRTRALG